MTDTPAKIWIVTEVEEVPGHRNSPDTGGTYVSNPRTLPTTLPKQTVRQRTSLDAAALKSQMSGLLQVVGEVFDQANQQSGLILDEVALSVEINGEGQVSILGNSGKLGNKGAINLKFKRVTPPS